MSVFSSPWFDSGYVFGVSLRGFRTNFTRALREGGLRIASTRLVGWSEEVHFSPHFRRIVRHFSHSARMDVSAHFSALDDEEFFVVEGSGWRGRRESDSQVFCHPQLSACVQ